MMMVQDLAAPVDAPWAAYLADDPVLEAFSRSE
jgi:hypothetical protein